MTPRDEGLAPSVPTPDVHAVQAPAPTVAHIPTTPPPPTGRTIARGGDDGELAQYEEIAARVAEQGVVGLTVVAPRAIQPDAFETASRREALAEAQAAVDKLEAEGVHGVTYVGAPTTDATTDATTE